jgi:hypothetical protein
MEIHSPRIGPNKTFRLVVALLVIILAGIVAAFLATETRRKNVVQDVSQQLRSGATQVSIAHAAKFPWNELFIFNPYYPKDDICQKIRLTTFQCLIHGIRDVDETEFILVFRQNSAISETERFPRAIADFEESENCWRGQSPRVRRFSA